MAEMTGRFEYFLWAFKRSLSDGATAKVCPACGSTGSWIVRRKYGVTALRECRSCALRFRTPKDDPGVPETFYADEVYKQGFTTDLPSDAELQAMLANKFAGTEKDFTYRIDVLRAAGLKPGGRILDFGCSWGYGSWQMRQAGFEVISYEIGRERARYAKEKLQCNMIADLESLDQPVDCFFSSHVIEHLPNPRIMFDAADKALCPGGLLVCFAPNGAVEREKRDFANYHQNWNKVHPLMLTPGFMRGEASRRGFEYCNVYSNPATLCDIEAHRDGNLAGDELLAIGRQKTIA
jgi:SAM-dependent methyltransferase